MTRLLPPSAAGSHEANPFAFNVKRFDPRPSARKFQAGTPPVPNLYASMRGIALLEEIGRQKIATQIERLTRVLFQGARDLGVALKSASDGVGPLVVFECTTASALVERMAACGIVCSSRHDGRRLPLHVYNLLSDVEAALDVIRQNLQSVIRRAPVGVTAHSSG